MMSDMNDIAVVKRQYATAGHLNTRISIHEKYSTNQTGFGNWIVSNYTIQQGMRVLELGCGTGEMWKNRAPLVGVCSKLILSDLSEGMVAAARENIGSYENVEYRVLDIQKIPYEDESFDIVIANMVLHHVPDIYAGVAEVRRVLKRGGSFYCATYGEHGIMEYLSKILLAYDIEDNMSKGFTLQNGCRLLRRSFSKVKKLEYVDSLAVTDVDDMVDYIYSLSDMTALKDVSKHIIKETLMQHLTNGILYVPKEYGMFIAS